MLTGESKLVGRALYVDVAPGANNATYILMSNNEPDLAGDQSEALRNRLLVIPWERTFIDKMLMESSEYSAGVADGTVMMKSDALKYQLMGKVDGYEMMPDVVLTWAFAGLRRVMNRSGSTRGSELSLPASVVERTAIIWAESDMITVFFRECGMFTEGGETIIASQGLWQRMKEWAAINDPAWCEELGDNARVLGQMFRHRAGRGYRPVKSTRAIWKGDANQPNGWAVPWTFKG
jgi:phage/plasmid-associated DNA primase